MAEIWQMVSEFISGAFGAMTMVITSAGTGNVISMWLIAIPIFGLVFGIVKGILHSSSGRKGSKRRGG